MLQVGHHDITLKIHGTSVIASLIHSIIRGFNVKKHVKTVISNIACLPRPSKLSNHIVVKIYLIYLGVWCLLFTTAYTQRLRHMICSFFYRKREKRRVLYLYNESLRRRHDYGKFMRAKIKALVRTRQLEYDMNLWIALRSHWPRLCSWLIFFACARQKCLVCGEVEPKRSPHFQKCIIPACPFVHCLECWNDVGKICYACTDTEETESDDYDIQHNIF